MNTWQQTRQPKSNRRIHPLDRHEEAMVEEPLTQDGKTLDEEVDARGQMFALAILYSSLAVCVAIVVWLVVG